MRKVKFNEVEELAQGMLDWGAEKGLAKALATSQQTKAAFNEHAHSDVAIPHSCNTDIRTYMPNRANLREGRFENKIVCYTAI